MSKCCRITWGGHDFGSTVGEFVTTFCNCSVFVFSYAKKSQFLSPNIKVKGKGPPRTGHKGPERQQRYSATFILTLGPRWGWVVNTTPRPLYPQK
jgi:hypothetical protein